MMYLTFIQKLHSLLKENDIDPMEWEIRAFDIVESSNDTVNDLFIHYDKIVVLANTQSKGRGRDGRIWESPEGGCWLSFGVKKTIPAIELSTPIVQAVNQVISKYFHSTIKAPNDIMVEGKKLAGILVKGTIQGNELTQVIIGVGSRSFFSNH